MNIKLDVKEGKYRLLNDKEIFELTNVLGMHSGKFKANSFSLASLSELGLLMIRTP